MNYKKIFLKQKLFYVFVLFTIALIVAKIEFSSVSSNGDNIYYCMTADYWNFAKDIANGKQIYVDLLDHKGIYLYFPYILMYLLGKNGVANVAIAETILYAITIASVFYLVYEKTNDKKKSIIFSFVFAVVYFLITTYTTLINVEGLVAPIYLLFYKWIVYQQKIDKKHFFFIGIILGIFFTIKYSSLLYFGYLFLFSTASFFFNNGKWKEYIKIVLFGLLGFLITTIPFVVYLFFTNTLKKYIFLMKYASFTKIGAISFYAILSIVFFILSMFLYKKRCESYEIPFILAILSISMIGIAWGSHYFSLLFTICVPILLANVDKRKKIISYTTIFFIFFILIFDFIITTNYCLQKIEYENTTKGISERYGMTNNNTLYLTEDLGFGAYSKETFRDVYQWIPVRMLAIDNFYNYLLELDRTRIQSKEYEYLISGDYTKIIQKEDLDPNEKMHKELFEDVQNNYDFVEMLYGNIALWKAKPK